MFSAIFSTSWPNFSLRPVEPPRTLQRIICTPTFFVLTGYISAHSPHHHPHSHCDEIPSLYLTRPNRSDTSPVPSNLTLGVVQSAIAVEPLMGGKILAFSPENLQFNRIPESLKPTSSPVCEEVPSPQMFSTVSPHKFGSCKAPERSRRYQIPDLA